MTMIQIAIQHGASVDVLKNLWDLQVQWEAHEARKAYVVAMNAFKANPPIVIKDMLNKQYDSRYSSLANFVNTVNPELSKFGLSACWRPDQTNGISVTCVVTHAQGHSESATLSGPPDDSGKKNPLQQIKSTITYLEGATFQAITGMVASDGSDDDGNGAGTTEVITTDQCIVINDLLTETKKPKEKFLEQFKFESLESIPASEYERVLLALNERKAKMAKRAQS